MVATDFREHLFPEDDPRISGFRGLSYREYAEVVKSDPFAGPMILDWATKYPEPYRGISTDGVITRCGRTSGAPGPTPSSCSTTPASASKTSTRTRATGRSSSCAPA
ncbi:MAG: hypothetical protein JWP54_1023 [Cryobacterium sp.]|jgi:hypothetical protein|nr:hypothetical protein [Cryobacterium sp.]